MIPLWRRHATLGFASCLRVFPATGSRRGPGSWAEACVACVWHVCGPGRLEPGAPAGTRISALRLLRAGLPCPSSPGAQLLAGGKRAHLLARQTGWGGPLSAPSDSCAQHLPWPRSVDRGEFRSGRGSCWQGWLWSLVWRGQQCPLSLQPAAGGTGGTQVPPTATWVQGGGWARPHDGDQGEGRRLMTGRVRPAWASPGPAGGGNTVLGDGARV